MIASTSHQDWLFYFPLAQQAALRKRAACGQTLADQVHQSGILEELIDRIEQIVFEQFGLPGQGKVE